MSAGVFTVVSYKTDSGEVGRVRVQPETVAATLGGAANAAATGTVTKTNRVRVSGSKRAYGTKARSVSFKWTGTTPTGYAPQGGRIVVPDPALFNTLVPGDTGTYLGAGITIIGKSAESTR